MSNGTATTDRIYDALKSALLAGRLAPHERLDFAEIARRLGASTTPVRESAMRLLGEGLLEFDARSGLRPLRWTEYRLRTLLEWHERIARLAIEWADKPDAAPPSPASDAAHEERARAFFRHLAVQTGNRELVAAIERAADALAPFRRREPVLLPDVGAELGRLEAIAHLPTQLRRGLRSYHRRRHAVVAQLIWTVTAESQAAPEWP